jgi:hypothetical protein
MRRRWIRKKHPNNNNPHTRDPSSDEWECGALCLFAKTERQGKKIASGPLTESNVSRQQNLSLQRSFGLPTAKAIPHQLLTQQSKVDGVRAAARDLILERV